MTSITKQPQSKPCIFNCYTLLYTLQFWCNCTHSHSKWTDAHLVSLYCDQNQQCQLQFGMVRPLFLPFRSGNIISRGISTVPLNLNLHPTVVSQVNTTATGIEKRVLDTINNDQRLSDILTLVNFCVYVMHKKFIHQLPTLIYNRQKYLHFWLFKLWLLFWRNPISDLSRTIQLLMKWVSLQLPIYLVPLALPLEMT